MPSGYIWKQPVLFDSAVPSYSVMYQYLGDFYYSGHCGLCVLAFLMHK